MLNCASDKELFEHIIELQDEGYEYQEIDVWRVVKLFFVSVFIVFLGMAFVIVIGGL